MKNGKAIFLSATVILGAAGMIFGNHVLASNAFAEVGEAPEQAIVMPEGAPVSALNLAEVEMRSNSDGVVYLASANRSDDVQNQEETQAADETYQAPDEVGKKATGDTTQTRNADIPKQEETQTADAANQSPDAAGRKATSVVAGSAEDPFKEGTPLENELSSDEAQEIATAAIVKKYALTQATLDKFTITTKYYEVTPEAPGKHTWWVSLYPTDNDDFSEIGCYWAYLDAETGTILQINSAVNGKG